MSDFLSFTDCLGKCQDETLKYAVTVWLIWPHPFYVNVYFSFCNINTTKEDFCLMGTKNCTALKTCQTLVKSFKHSFKTLIFRYKCYSGVTACFIMKTTNKMQLCRLTLRLLMSYIYIYIYIWSAYSWCF